MRAHVAGAILVAVVGGAAGAAAQEPDVIFFGAGLDTQGGIRIAGAPGVPFEMPIDVLAAKPLDDGKAVTGAPYSADITTEIVQQLADGNRIERRSTSSVARDREGRVRREQQVMAIGPVLPTGNAQIVTIDDPVANVHYSLDAARKIVIQLPTPFAAKFEGPAPGGPAVVARAEKRELVVQPPLALGQAPDQRTEKLGTTEIEGVTAEGTRVTITIPAGAIGNQSPIEIVSERWYSPELQTVVLSRRTDPRFGETTYRLANVVRAEPPAELFQIPSDYKIEQPKVLQFNTRKVPPPAGQ